MKQRQISFILFVILITLSQLVHSDQYQNPILPGAHPDPSICRVGEDYYIVNSTFEHYPALPISHSTDLVNWQLIGYGIDRPEQCESIGMFDVQQNGGIHAPTIRYNNGTFYIIVTSVYLPTGENAEAEMINFVLTAKDPAGPWSEPHIIRGAVGIDPDIFFDDDNTVWYIGTCSPGDIYSNGIGEIWGQRLDINKWELIGERYSLWNGSCGGFCLEGPHMYKHNGTYYLMAAEGGTGYEHSEIISASKRVTGPFESNLRNPIITSRHLSFDYWVTSIGHADMVQLSDNRWYMVCLGIRNEGPEHRSNMGRETHLIPVIWEQDGRHWLEHRYWWPVCAPATGRVERSTTLPFHGLPQLHNNTFTDNFDSEKLNLEWNFRRCPKPDTYSLSARKGYLRLNLSPDTFSYRKQYSFMGILQKESCFEYSASMQFQTKQKGAEAGIALCQLDDNYITMTICRQNKGYNLRLVVDGRNTEAEIIKEKEIEDYTGNIIFKVESDNKQYVYSYSLDEGENYEIFATTPADLILCYSYSGARLGIYATSNGRKTSEHADFDWVRYTGLPKTN